VGASVEDRIPGAQTRQVMRLWGGRFAKEPAEEAFRFTASLPFDKRLWRHDVRGSMAHARMLGRCGIITRAESARIVAGLRQIERRLLAEEKEKGEPDFDPSSEDIHTEIERLLGQRIGRLAGKLHTARSRNDQAAVDMRLYVKDEVARALTAVAGLQAVVARRAEEHVKPGRETILPGYTHRQKAQPVLLCHHLLSYFWALERDRGRFADCLDRADVLPLGAAALGGTSFPVDPESVAKELGFSRTFENSMDAVSDRDFVLEFLSAASITMLHLSCLAEELVFWNSGETGFARLDEAWCGGSSIMPQKRNPDAAELVSAKAPRVAKHLVGLLGAFKSLPRAYNLHLQEDKEALFDAADTLAGSLAVVTGMLKTVKFFPKKMEQAAGEGFSVAVEAADYLVRKGVPFRQAHEVVGKAVRICEERGIHMNELPMGEWRRLSRHFEPDLLDKLTPRGAVSAKRSPGGTAPARVREQLRAARRALARKAR
jgi:argininosuccinate lyase